MFLTCPNCHKRHRRNESWRYGDFCSYSCYLALPFPRVNPHITWDEVKRVCSQYPNQKTAAKAIGVSYVRFRRIIAKAGLREQFPAHGGSATWA